MHTSIHSRMRASVGVTATIAATLAATIGAALATARPLVAQAAQNPGSISPSPEEPPTRQGTRGANFLQLGIGARENAMAGAVSSIVTGPTSWYWNPAGAAAVQGFSAVATRQQMYTDLDITMNYVGVAIPVGG